MRTAQWLLLLIGTLLLTACEQSSYDEGTGELSLTQADFVEAFTDNHGATYKVVVDDGEEMMLTAPVTRKGMLRPDTTYRAILYYNKTSALQAEAVSWSAVPTIVPTPLSEVKEMKTDPISFESLWMSCAGKYLNLGCYLKVGDTQGEQQKHTLGVVLTHKQRNDDGSSTAYLTLYHDQGGVPAYYSSKFYISIICSSLNCDSVCLTLPTFQGELVKRVKL